MKMKLHLIAGFAATALAAVSLQPASAQPVSLTGTSYTNTFDNLEAEAGPPGEWYTYTAASATAPGTLATWSLANYTSSSNYWRNTSGRFANQASTFSYIGGTNFLGTETNNPIQFTEPNRCLAVRQVSATDMGAAFVIKIADTLGRKNFVLTLDSLNLDSTSTRTTTWTVDYGFGTVPSVFVPVTTFANAAGTFSTNHRTITFPNGTIDNNAGPLWIRIVVLTPTSGSGNRETTGIDNVGLTWEMGVACTPVTITANPTPVPGYINGNAKFTVGALGTEPRSYVWVQNGTTVLSDDGHFGGTTTPILTITTLQPGDAGTYSCIVSNACDGALYSQTSTAAALTVSTPPTETIAYLHTLVDPTTWGPTNSSLLYQATGIITTYTNTTTANTASYYLQDGTGGINLFCTFGSTFRPSLGDVVTAIGFLSSFGGNLELEADLSNPAQSVTILSNNIAAYPAAVTIPWDNLYQFGTNANLNYNLQGSVVLLTNVYFGVWAGVVTTNGNYNMVVTNANGQVARVLLPAALDNDLTNRTIPTFAYAVRGPLVATTSGYQVMPTLWSEVVTIAPGVTLDTPADGSSLTAPANITLSATVTSNGYPISAVNFYQGATLLGSATTPPYSYAWNGVGAGSYPLSAKAVYPLFGADLTTASAVNTLTVTSSLAPVTGVTISVGAGNTLNIAYAGGSASHFVLLGTNNVNAPLATWPVIQTTNGTTPAVFNVPIGSDTQMYYNIQSQ
jgi:hypothetical protein